MPEYELGRHRGKYAVVWYTERDDPATGKRVRTRHRRSLGTDKPGEARTLLAEYVKQLERLKRPERHTVGGLVEAYIKAKSDDPVRKARMDYAWAALASTFEHLYPEHVNEDLCKTYWAARRSRGKSSGTVHVELGMLRAAMNWAVKPGRLIAEAPDVWLPTKPAPLERHLTPAEVHKLLDACEMPHLKLFAIVALNTAGRMGAVLDLTWDRVDLERRRLDLRDPERGETPKGRAVVAINDWLYEALSEAYRGRLSPYVIEWGGKKVKRIQKGFREAVRRAGIDHCTPHTLRHTAAVWMAEAGVEMAEIAQYLGHTDMRITFKVYAKFSPEHQRKAAEAIGSRFMGNKEHCAKTA